MEHVPIAQKAGRPTTGPYPNLRQPGTSVFAVNNPFEATVASNPPQNQNLTNRFSFHMFIRNIDRRQSSRTSFWHGRRVPYRALLPGFAVPSFRQRPGKSGFPTRLADRIQPLPGFGLRLARPHQQIEQLDWGLLQQCIVEPATANAVRSGALPLPRRSRSQSAFSHASHADCH